MFTFSAIAAAIAAWLTPAAASVAAGGGLAALIGGIFSSKGKLILTLGGIAALVIAVVAFTAHYEHLKRDADAYKSLRVEVSSIEKAHGCPARPPHERDLVACLTAEQRDAANAARVENERLQAEATKARDDLKQANDLLASQARTIDDLIDNAPPADDGPVPKILLDLWTRERQQRGVK